MGSVAPFGSLADQSSDAASDIDVSDAAADGADVDVDLDDIGDTVSGDTGFLSILLLSGRCILQVRFIDIIRQVLRADR